MWDLFPNYKNGQPPDDSHLLEKWRNVPLYDEGHRWVHDDHTLLLGTGEGVFTAAAYHLLRYHFYPPDVMHHTADFTREGRAARLGDRVVIRLHILRPLLDVLAMNVITTVIEQPRRAKIGYTTTARHTGTGTWSAEVTWQPNNDVILRVQSRSRMRGMATLPLARLLQLRAHKRGMANLKANLSTRP